MDSSAAISWRWKAVAILPMGVFRAIEGFIPILAMMVFIRLLFEVTTSAT